MTKVFPCIFLSFKANARVQHAKTGHGQHSSQLGFTATYSTFNFKRDHSKFESQKASRPK